MAVTKRTASANCQCNLLPPSLDESEMPDGATATFVTLTEVGGYLGRCSACKQCWEFYFCGRHDIPTFQKLGWREAKAIMAARDARREEEAARKAEQEQEWLTTFARQEQQAPTAEPTKLSLFLTRLMRIAALAAFAIGMVVTIPMMFAGGDPPSQRLALAGGAFVTGIVLAGWYNWRTR